MQIPLLLDSADPRSEENEAKIDEMKCSSMVDKVERSAVAIRAQLVELLSAPSFSEDSLCFACQKPFGISLFRHHCRACGRSFCDEHSNAKRRLNHIGIVQSSRVCNTCAIKVDGLARNDQLGWKECRLNAYFCNKLIPYFDHVIDRGIDKAMRFILKNHLI
jgi:hypothetical protein